MITSYLCTCTKFIFLTVVPTDPSLKKIKYLLMSHFLLMEICQCKNQFIVDILYESNLIVFKIVKM